MANRTKLTRKKRDEFIQKLSATGGNVSAAARQVGMSRGYVYELKGLDAEFAQAWDEAVEAGIDDLEQEARRRAYEGTDEPVFYQGVEVGTVRRYSDTLTIVLLKAHRPEKYRERYDVKGSLNLDVSKLTDEQLNALAAGQPIAPVASEG